MKIRFEGDSSELWAFFSAVNGLLAAATEPTTEPASESAIHQSASDQKGDQNPVDCRGSVAPQPAETPDTPRRKCREHLEFIPSDIYLRCLAQNKSKIAGDLRIKKSTFAAYVQRRKAPQDIIAKLAKYFKLQVKQEVEKITLPDWVTGISDREKRRLVEQEYYINVEQAKRFAECDSAEEIKELRRREYEMANLPGESSMT